MKNFAGQTGIRVSLTAFDAVKHLDGDKRTVLYRVAQEALTNVARHAHASRAEVKIQKVQNQVSLKIRDNGKGFEADRVLHSKKSVRLGLLGMRERVEMVSGSLTIKSTPGKGTTIHARVPFSIRSGSRPAHQRAGRAGPLTL
jgi:signal transduction histidine kinase